jgi:hypothetical protein
LDRASGQHQGGDKLAHATPLQQAAGVHGKNYGGAYARFDASQ